MRTMAENATNFWFWLLSHLFSHFACLKSLLLHMKLKLNTISGRIYLQLEGTDAFLQKFGVLMGCRVPVSVLSHFRTSVHYLWVNVV